MYQVLCIKYFLVFILTTLYLLLNTPLVSAHVLETDNTVGAVIHIDPGDEPIAKQPSAIFFEFKDKEDIFNVDQCNCTVSILKGGSVVYTILIESPQLTYTFPEKGDYQIKVAGKPIEEDTFLPFDLVYDVQVAKEAVVSSSPPTQKPNWISEHRAYLIGGAIVFVFLIFAISKQKKL